MLLTRNKLILDVHRPRRSGAAALELVMILPVLMVIVVGAADWSRVLHYENVLTNAARTGAAYGATHQFTEYIYDDWEARVIAEAAQEAAHLPDFDASQLVVNVSTFDEADGSKRILVEVSYPYEMIVDWPVWPQQIVLVRRVSMRGYR